MHFVAHYNHDKATTNASSGPGPKWAGAPGITSEMIEAGLLAFDVFGDSPPRVLVEEVLRAALTASPRRGTFRRLDPRPMEQKRHGDG